MRGLMEQTWKDLHEKGGYELLYTPHIANVELWKTSGHFDFYADGMFDQMDVRTCVESNFGRPTPSTRRASVADSTPSTRRRPRDRGGSTAWRLTGWFPHRSRRSSTSSSR